MEVSLAGIPWYGWLAGVVVSSLALWQHRRVAVILGRPVPPDSDMVDDIMWRAGDVFASGLSVPVVIIGYDRLVRVYNRGAEDLTGHPFHAIHRHPFGLMLPDEDEDAFNGFLDRYLKDYREGDTVQMVGHERPLTILRPDGGRRCVAASLTHFGNGHGGIQIELRPSA